MRRQYRRKYKSPKKYLSYGHQAQYQPVYHPYNIQTQYQTLYLHKMRDESFVRPQHRPAKDETFSYDLSDSFIQELAGCGNYYWFDAMDGYERIIYNTQSEYLISINGIEGDDVIIINLKQPNEIIDYR